MKKNTKGFTLLELLTVITILALLAAISVPVYRTYIERAQSTEIVLRYDAVRTGIQANLSRGEISDCGEIVAAGGTANLGDDYARLSVGFDAVSGGNLQGYKPVFLVCASYDIQGEQGVRVARAAYDEFSLTNIVNPGAVISESMISFSVPLSSGDVAACQIPVGGALTACGARAQVPTAALAAVPSRAVIPTPAVPTPAVIVAPSIVPTVEAVNLMRSITGATALSAYTGEQRGVPLGTQVVGLYMAGSSVNQLAGAASSQLPTITQPYTAVADAGYQYLNGSGALGQLMPTMAANLQALAPSERNAWDGGIVVFSDGSVGRMQKAANGANSGEKDYIYFSVLSGVNANDGMTIVTGHAQAGQTVQVSVGGRDLATVTADAQGNWNLAGAAALAFAGQTITANPVTP